MMKDETSNIRILIVDDVKANIDVLVEGLGADYKISVATSGEKALQTALRNPPDLILLDIVMPGMDGYEVCRRLRASRQTEDIPVMFLSGLGEVANKALGFEVGGNDYLTRPFEMIEVKARIRSLLRARSRKVAVASARDASTTDEAGKSSTEAASPETAFISRDTPIDPTRPTSMVQSPQVWVGKSLGKYSITGVLGQGGMGVVLKAHDPMIDRDVAIKVLADHLATDAAALMRFLSEAKAAGKLNHPNVIAIYEICQEGQTYYLVLEYAAGGSLGDAVGRGKYLGVLEATQALSDACKGVGAAHAVGLVHRDIKPANFMRTADGTIKVADFGLAKAAADAGAHLTQTGMVIGTPYFMSPEQCEAKPIDHRSDIYSLGCTYYSLLTGKTPYHDTDSVPQLMYLHCHGPLPDPRTVNASVPEACSRIVARAMAKAPADRYQSAAAMQADLDAVAAGFSRSTPIVLPSGAYPTVLHEDGTRLRHRFRWAAAALGTLAIVAGFAWYAWRKPGVVQEVSSAVVPNGDTANTGVPAGQGLHVLAVLPFTNTANDAETEYLSDGIPGALLRRLSVVEQLTVRPYRASRQKGPPDSDLREIGKQLEAPVVLTGRVHQRRDHLSVHVELVNVDDNRLIWVEQYERRPADLQDIEADIAERVCVRMGVSYSRQEERRLTRRYTADPEAYRLYLQGRYHAQQSTLEAMKQSLACFKEAIAKDPKYALAYAGLADSYGYYAGDWLPYEEALPQQKVAAQKAMELDDEVAETHLAMGNVYMGQDYDWTAAEKEFKRAIELKPKLDLAHDAYAQLLAFQGRFEESMARQQRALEIGPNSPSLIADMSYLFYVQRQYDRAIEQCQKALEIDPNFVVAHDYLGAAYLQKGQYENALAEFRKCRQLDNIPWYLARVAAAEALAGNQSEAHSLLKELQDLSKRRYVTPECHFLVYVGLRENDQAFAWLQTMYDVRSQYPLRLKVQPDFDGLRTDRRYAEWLRRLNLAAPG